MPPGVRVSDRAAGRFRLVSWLFAHTEVHGAVTTRVRLNASPGTVWDHIMPIAPATSSCQKPPV